MKKFKFIWIVGICALVFCGKLGTSNLVNQVSEIFIDPAVPDEISAKLREKIGEDHAKLDDLFEMIRDKTDEELDMMLKQIETDFATTYLKNPKNIQTDKRGWGEVIRGLRDIAGHPNISKTTKVRLHYIPYKGVSSFEEDIDLKAIIMTKLKGSPDIDLEGALLHRRLCEFR